MITELSGWLWFVAIFGGPLLLGVALAYGAIRSHRRSQMRKIHTREPHDSHTARRA